MTHGLKVGEIIESRRSSGELTLEWRISDFRMRSEDSEWLASPFFSFCNECWSLDIDLNVLRLSAPEPTDPASVVLLRAESNRCMELTLTREKLGRPMTVTVTIAVKVPDGLVKKVETREVFTDDRQICWLREYCSMSEMRSGECGLVPDDVLTISCSLKSDDVPKISLRGGQRNVIRSLREILTEGWHSDFTLAVGERQWHVHKAILASRSEYFASMFRRDWTENAEGRASFDDVSAGVMDSVLHFIYTGEVGDATVDEVCEIYTAADRFLLEDMKPLCVESMVAQMGSDLLCGALAIAEIYGEKRLIEAALRFLHKMEVHEEACMIFGMRAWKEFARDHPATAAEIVKGVDDFWDD